MGEEVCIFKPLKHHLLHCKMFKENNQHFAKNFYHGFSLQFGRGLPGEVEGQGSGKVLEVEGQKLAEPVGQTRKFLDRQAS